MPQALTRLVVHIVIATGEREPVFVEPEFRKELFLMFAGLVQRAGCTPILVNGREEHVHILCGLSRILAVETLVDALRDNTAEWIRTQGHPEFQWQKGYAAFSVSESRLEATRRFIATQEKYHERLTFEEEYRAIAIKHGLDINEFEMWE